MNCSEIEVLFDRVRLPTISNYSRFALPVTVVSSDDLVSNEDSSIRLEQYSSMDDEYSPGIFQVSHDRRMSCNLFQFRAGKVKVNTPLVTDFEVVSFL
jgi:hypothetical protein